jgi:hypothetical protein
LIHVWSSPNFLFFQSSEGGPYSMLHSCCIHSFLSHGQLRRLFGLTFRPSVRPATPVRVLARKQKSTFK